jgi:hypothetical protein
VFAHDLADGDGRFTCVVEGDRGHEVVADVRADDVVEEMRVDEAQVAIDGGAGTARKSPCVAVVMWEGAVGVLEEGDCDYEGDVRYAVMLIARVDRGRKKKKKKKVLFLTVDAIDSRTSSLAAFVISRAKNK